METKNCLGKLYITVVWKLFHDALPVKIVLAPRGSNCEVKFTFCHKENSSGTLMRV